MSAASWRSTKMSVRFSASNLCTCPNRRGEHGTGLGGCKGRRRRHALLPEQLQQSQKLVLLRADLHKLLHRRRHNGPAADLDLDGSSQHAPCQRLHLRPSRVTTRPTRPIRCPGLEDHTRPSPEEGLDAFAMVSTTATKDPHHALTTPSPRPHHALNRPSQCPHRDLTAPSPRPRHTRNVT